MTFLPASFVGKARRPRKLKPAEPRQLELHDVTTREPFHRRTFAPVHRDSFPAGECEQAWFSALPAAERRGAVHAAMAYNQHYKGQGDRFGPLGANGPAILQALLEFMDRATGWLDPAIDTIAEKLKIHRKTVIATLSKLRAHGFVRWIRRFERTEGQGIRGPQVRQTSNAYKLSVPDKARRLLPWRFKVKPPPACETAHHDERARARLAMELDPRSSPLAASLDRWSVAIKGRLAGPNASRLTEPESP